MRLATWNIRAGGGKRIPAISSALIEERADILVLTEFRHAPGRALLEKLDGLYPHVLSGASTGPQNSVCVLSRYPMLPVEASASPGSRQRWVAVRVPQFDLTVLGVHVPNQFEVWNKREFWSCIDAFAQESQRTRAVILGDLNTALDEDCEGEPIREAIHLRQLLDSGWGDVWRHCNPEGREFSWYSHRQNGFRLDHCLVSPLLTAAAVSCEFRHPVRVSRLSDHSLLSVCLDI